MKRKNEANMPVDEAMRNAMQKAVDGWGTAEGKGWLMEAAAILGMYELRQCKRCEGYGEHRRKEDCDCHDPHNCIHRDQVPCRKCKSSGVIYEKKGTHETQ